MQKKLDSKYDYLQKPREKEKLCLRVLQISPFSSSSSLSPFSSSSRGRERESERALSLSLFFLNFWLHWVFFFQHLYWSIIALQWCVSFCFVTVNQLYWVFVAVRGLSLVAVSGGYSSLRCTGFSLRWLLLVEHGLQACGLQQLWRTGLVALQHVGSSRTRARTHASCIARRILNYCATREAQDVFLEFFTLQPSIPLLENLIFLSLTWSRIFPPSN